MAKKKFPVKAVKGAMLDDAEDRAEAKAGHPPSAAEEKSEDKKGSGPHPGFKALVARGVPAGALANAARNASPAAKRKNPNLRKVK